MNKEEQYINSIINQKTFTEFTDGSFNITETIANSNSNTIPMKYCSLGITSIAIDENGSIIKGCGRAQNNKISDNIEYLNDFKPNFNEVTSCLNYLSPCDMCYTAMYGNDIDTLKKYINIWKKIEIDERNLEYK